MVRGSRHVSSTSGPVDVNVLALRQGSALVLRLHAESVSAKVVSLCLQKVGRQVLRPVTIVERQSGGEGRRGDTKLDTLNNRAPPATLSLVDGVLEEVVEKQVLEFGIYMVGFGNVRKEDGPDNATTTPHKGNGGVVELPRVLPGSLQINLHVRNHAGALRRIT
jgi:hypothetical protein